MTQRRILFLVPWFEMGGADKFNLDLMRLLTRRGYEFVICNTLSAQNKWLPLFEPLARAHIDLPQAYPLAEQPQALLDIIRTYQIEVLLISNSYVGYLLLPLIRSQFPGLTVVDYLHMEEERWRNGGFPVMSIQYQSLLDLTVVSTRHLKNWMVTRGGDEQKIEVCTTNIDPQEWDPANYDVSALRAGLSIEPDTPVLLYSGRIVTQKRPQFFAKVVQRLVHREQLSCYCIVAGDGDELPGLKQLTRQLEVSQYITFAGEVSLNEMKQFHALADIFFLPSQNEGLSLAVFEAMAMLTVPVVADVGGQKELVTPDCGFVVPHTDNEIEQYVARLKLLIRSAQLKQAMAAAGRQRIERHFPLSRMGESMHRLLQRAVQAAAVAERVAISLAVGQLTAARAIDFLKLERDFLQATHYIAQLPDYSSPAVVAQRLPIRYLLGGLWLKLLRKFGIKEV